MPGVALAVLVLSMGCRDFVGHGSAARISHNLTTDAERYLAVAGTDVQGRSTYSVRVIATYTNSHDGPVVLQTCSPGSLQYRVYVAGSSVPAAYDPTWWCLAINAPVVVAAGAARVDTLVLSGPPQGGAGTSAPIGQISGVFTLVYVVGVGSNSPDSGSTGTVVSNPFTITLPAST